MQPETLKNFLQKLFPWGLLFLFSIALLILPAYSCTRQSFPPPKTAAQKVKYKNKSKKYTRRFGQKKDKNLVKSSEWSILN